MTGRKRRKFPSTTTENGIPPDQIEDILNARDRAAAGPTAPARGLTLIGMEYEENAGKA